MVNVAADGPRDRNGALTNSADWQETLDDLDRRRAHSLGMGGPGTLAKHHAKGKLDVRAASTGCSTRAPSASSAPSPVGRSPPTASSPGPG
jgi:hypothetical protein